MKQTCIINPIMKYIRIALSLIVIGVGIYYKNWLGAIGVITLISAFTGDCALSPKFKRDFDFKLKDSDNSEKKEEQEY